MGKSISKAFKKVTNNALNSVGLGQDMPEAPKVADPAAQPVDVPVEQQQVNPEEETASDVKKTKRVGKSQLQVSRTSGGGISL